jgi:uncharacterized phage protein (TIGR02220 family)
LLRQRQGSSQRQGRTGGSDDVSLFVKVFTNFYTHRKTMRLRASLGDDAFWIVPRLWAYAAENQPDGDFASYTDGEIAGLIGYNKDASSMLQALLQAGFMDSDRKIHDWADHNGYHQGFSDRARAAAKARWDKQKERTKEKGEEMKGEDRIGEETSNASSMLQASPKHEKIDRYHKDCRAVLHFLNETACVHYREVDANLRVISERLFEPDVTLEGVKAMIQRQSRKWRGTEYADYLRPETLFRKSKFDGYYAAKDQPISTNGKLDHRAEKAAKEYQQVITAKLL